MIAPQEIGKAIQLVIKDACGMRGEEVPQAACRALGFARVTEEMRERVQTIIKALLAGGILALSGEHLVVSSRHNFQRE